MSTLVTIERTVRQVVEVPQDGLTMQNFGTVDPNIIRVGGTVVGESITTERVVDVGPKP